MAICDLEFRLASGRLDSGQAAVSTESDFAFVSSVTDHAEDRDRFIHEDEFAQRSEVLVETFLILVSKPRIVDGAISEKHREQQEYCHS